MHVRSTCGWTISAESRLRYGASCGAIWTTVQNGSKVVYGYDNGLYMCDVLYATPIVAYVHCIRQADPQPDLFSLLAPSPALMHTRSRDSSIHSVQFAVSLSPFLEAAMRDVAVSKTVMSTK